MKPSNSLSSFFSSWQQDLPAGLVVFLVALPLCLGIALACNAPMFSGLIAGIIGGTIIALISGSQLGVSGPAAGLVVIVIAGIETLGSFEAFLFAGMVAGIFQLIMGIGKLGFVSYYIPNSVIKGMLAGIGIIIALKQIPHAVGYDGDFEGDLAFWQMDGQNTLTELGNMFSYLSPAAITISVIGLALLIFADRPYYKSFKISRYLSGPLMAVLAGVILHIIFVQFFPESALDATHLVAIPVLSGFDELSTLFTFPDWSQWNNPMVYQIGLVLALVASLETLLVSEATDKLDPYKRTTPTNRELVAQGFGNFTAGLVGGIPITQVIVRSSANIQSGGKTKASSFFHGIFLLVCVLLIPGVLNMIPLAALAAVLIMVGFKLAKPSLFIELYKKGMAQFIPFVATILGILFTDLLIGVGIGLAISIFFILRTHYQNSFSIGEQETGDEHKVQLNLAEEVTFLNKASLRKMLSEIKEGSEVEINAMNTVHIDEDIKDLISDFQENAETRGIKLDLKGFDQDGGPLKQKVKAGV